VGGDENDRESELLTYMMSGVNPVHRTLDVDIHKHKIRRRGLNQAHSLLRRGRHRGNVKARVGKQPFHVKTNYGLVFNDKNFGRMTH
jgi:hypothetical protein